MNTTDYSTWYTKQAAADAIGVSVKSIENFGVQGKITSVLWRAPGRSQLRVYSPEDVQRMAQSRREGGSPSYVAGPANPAPSAPAVLPPSRDTNVARVAPALNAGNFLEVLARELTTKSSTNLATNKLCLTIPEAAEFAGLSETFIRRACIDGTLAAFRDGRTWKVRRAALVALYGSPQAQTTAG